MYSCFFFFFFFLSFTLSHWQTSSQDGSCCPLQVLSAAVQLRAQRESQLGNTRLITHVQLRFEATSCLRRQNTHPLNPTPTRTQLT